MKSRTILLLILCSTLLHFPLSGKAINPAAWQISDSITNGSDAIIITYSKQIEVVGNKAIVETHKIVKILNQNGVKYGNLRVFYTPESPVKSIKGTVYSSSGERVRRIKRREIKDVSATGASTLFDENREKRVEIHYPLYPYFVEYSYQQTLNEFIGLPLWLPQNGYRLGVLNSTLTLRHLTNERVKSKHINARDPIVTIDDEFTQLQWQLQNLTPIPSEQFSEIMPLISPTVILVPECFEFHGSKGCMSTWDEYGQWVNGLIEGRDSVSLNTQNHILDLIKSAESEREKVRLIYKYMQDNTRYVSIQLGIGGFQPFPATTVEQYGYGDCKALSNYTKALLKVAGIESFYTEIGVSRFNLTYTDFPSAFQTDHVILMVPLENDTLWLECTNSRLPFGMIPHSHQGQNVLVVTPNGGEIKRIPDLGSEANIQQRHGELSIDQNGNAKGKLTTLCFEGEISNLMPELWVSSREQQEIINRKYRYPNLRINEFNYEMDDSTKLLAKEEIGFTINSLATRTGRRLFLKLNSFALLQTPPAKDDRRFSDISVNQSFTHTDTMIYFLPTGYSVEALPENLEVKNEFGTYTAEFKVESNKLTHTKTFRIEKKKHPATQYNAFVDFFSQIVRNENLSVVLVQEGDN